MKFYKEIIGINKDAPTTELTMTFSNNGFEFNNNLYLNGGKKLFLNGNGGSAILFRNSGITIDDLSDHGLRFSGNNRTILFDFSNGNIEATNLNLGPNWNLGSILRPLNDIYSTSGHFNILLSPSSIINPDTFNVKDLNITSTNPVTLPKNSEIRVFNTESLDIAGARIYNATTNYIGGIKMRTSTASPNSWTDTDQQVIWQTIITTGSEQACFQFFAKIDTSQFGTSRIILLIPPPPFLSSFAWDADNVFQLSYSGGQTSALPAIEPFVYDNKNYLQVQRINNLTCLYIQITRFKNSL